MSAKKEPVHSTPNRMVWEYLEMLRHLLSTKDVWAHKAWERKYSAIIVIMSVTVVETFMNVFFRTLVEREKYRAHRYWVIYDIKKRVSIEEKLRKWPMAIFGQDIRFDKGLALQFQATKKVRNFLVHFTTDHETVGVPDVFFEGMANTTEYDTLTKDDAASAISAAEGVIEEVLRLSGISGEELAVAVHHWTGKRG